MREEGQPDKPCPAIQGIALMRTLADMCHNMFAPSASKCQHQRFQERNATVFQLFQFNAALRAMPQQRQVNTMQKHNVLIVKSTRHTALCRVIGTGPGGNYRTQMGRWQDPDSLAYQLQKQSRGSPVLASTAALMSPAILPGLLL